MKNEDKIILDGVISVFEIENNGRIYSQDVFDKHLIVMKQKMKQKQRREKLKNII